MNERDPIPFGDAPDDLNDAPFDESADGLELPLEMFFAEDRGDPEALAAGASLEADVLSRVGSERGFVSRRKRTLIKTCRGVALMGALCVVLVASVADRLGVAPWNHAASGAAAGPVSGLVASTSGETADTIERAIDLRDRLLRVVEAPAQSELPTVTTVTLRQAPGIAAPETLVERPAVLREPLTGGPYLTAEGFGAGGLSAVTTIIRFEDGFSVPAMASDASSELRWPASREVTASVVSFHADASQQKPARLSPVWYADRRTDRGR